MGVKPHKQHQYVRTTASRNETVSTTRTYWGDNSTLREIKSQTTVNGNTTQLMTSKHIFSKDVKVLGDF